MKTVFSKTAEVAEAWAAQEMTHARTSSNTSFRDSKMLSYGTIIARIVEVGGKRCVLATSRRYSSGTSKVQGEACGAARRRGLAVFEVPELDTTPHAIHRNLDHYNQRVIDACDAIERSVRWDTARHHRAEALRLIGEATMFGRAMGQPFIWDGPNPMTLRGRKED